MSKQVYPGNIHVFTSRGPNKNIIIKANPGETLTIEGTATGTPTLDLSDGHIYIGSASNVATDKAVSGDATLANTGVLTLANTAVTPASYTNTSLTVDSKGRITAASSGSIPATTTQLIYNNAGALAGDSTLTFNNSTKVLTSSVINIGDGTVGAPSISFTNEPDCGFYKAGTNLINISTGGANSCSFGTGASVSSLVSVGHNASDVSGSAGTGCMLSVSGTQYFDGANNQLRAPMEVINTTTNGVNITPVQINFLNSSNVVCGSIYRPSESSVALALSSDHRLKENIEDIENGLDKINNLLPVSWNWKSGGGFSAGFLAHEYIETMNFSESGLGTKDQVDNSGNPVYQSINTNVLFPYIVSALQQLSASIEILKNKVNQLENP